MFAEEEIEVQGDHTASKRQKGILIRVCVEPGPLTLTLFCVLVGVWGRGVLGAHRCAYISVFDSLPPDAGVPTSLCGECPVNPGAPGSVPAHICPCQEASVRLGNREVVFFL